jgi:hypothetical protein
MLSKVFKAYDVRATYPKPLNERLAWQIGYGAAEYLLAQAAEATRMSARGYTRVLRVARTIADFHRDMAALGVAAPDEEPRATGTIPEMIALIERLIANGHAYAAEGHVLFAVGSFAQYGKLSGRSPDELRSTTRRDIGMPLRQDRCSTCVPALFFVRVGGGARRLPHSKLPFVVSFRYRCE